MLHVEMIGKSGIDPKKEELLEPTVGLEPTTLRSQTEYLILSRSLKP